MSKSSPRFNSFVYGIVIDAVTFENWNEAFFLSVSNLVSTQLRRSWSLSKLHPICHFQLLLTFIYLFQYEIKSWATIRIISLNELLHQNKGLLSRSSYWNYILPNGIVFYFQVVYDDINITKIILIVNI